MIKVFAIIVMLALVAGQPAAKPDFSGEWRMNAAKSDFGALPPPEFITRSITHAEPSLVIVEEQRSGLGDQKNTRKYVTDGTEMSFDANGAAVRSAATWTGNTLVVVSSVDAIGLTFNDRMSLSADRKALTSVVRISSPQGDVELTVVFDRQ